MYQINKKSQNVQSKKSTNKGKMLCHIKKIPNLNGYSVLFEMIVFTVNTIVQCIQWGLLCSPVSLRFLSMCIPQTAALAQNHCIKS